MSFLDADTSPPPKQFAWSAALYGLLTALAIAGSGFGGYFYAKAEAVSMTTSQTCDLQDIKDRLDKLTKRPESRREGSAIPGAVTLEDIEDQLSGIAKDIQSLQFDVQMIESEVSSLRLKIGY